MPDQERKDAFRVASATPALVALLGTANEGLREQATKVMERFVRLDSSSSDDELVSSGGIALLCENLRHSSSDQLQTVTTIAKLSASPVNAAAIADSGSVDTLIELIDGDCGLPALVTLANLSRLGSLRVNHLQPPSALAALAAACAPENSLEKRAAALTCVAQASLDSTCRLRLAEKGAPPHLVASLRESSASHAEARQQACHALAQFAADEKFRAQMAPWGALRPLCAQMSASVQSDARTRAMALSAVANVSFVDADELARSGAPQGLAEVLFDSDASMLRMALTAVSNLLQAPTAAASVAEALLSSGGALALPNFLDHPDSDVASLAVTAVMHACKHRSLAAPLAEAGAAPAVVAGASHACMRPSPSLHTTLNPFHAAPLHSNPLHFSLTLLPRALPLLHHHPQLNSCNIGADGCSSP